MTENKTIFAAVKAIAGKEYIYSPSSAHGVSKTSGAAIVAALNKARWDLKDNEVWRIIELDKYDSAYNIARCYQFKIYRGSIRVARYLIAA